MCYNYTINKGLFQLLLYFQPTNRFEKRSVFMQLTRTINADKRYYLDEDEIQNVESLIQTMERFNHIKIKLYNCLYDKSFLKRGPLLEGTYSSWLKRNYGTTDYYNCAIYTYASSVLSSQKELNRLYQRTKEKDIKARNQKIKRTQEELEKKQGIKSSLRTYFKSGVWERPYPKCRIRMERNQIFLPNGTYFPAEEYERKIERSIRRLKTRIALLESSKKRAIQRLEWLKKFPPKRIVFGGRKQYQKKDNPKVDREQWKQEFFESRHASMSLPGRHTSKNCNFLVRKEERNLIVKCMDGKETVFKKFHLARQQELWEEMLQAKKQERKAICYNFQLKREKTGRRYLIVSVTLLLENKDCNESLEKGCVSIDLNYDHVAVSELDEKGNRLGGTVIRFSPELKTKGQISEEIGRVMAKVGRYCAERKKPLIMEDLDTTLAKHGMKYGCKKKNRHASLFAYRKMTSCLENQAYKQSFGIYKMNPAYTSQMGKFLYLRPFGLSIHEAASYTIGLKGMGIREKLLPNERLLVLLPEKAKEKLKNGTDIVSIIPAWKQLTKAFRGVSPHSFYRELPYEVLEERKKGTLKSIASEMKKWTQNNRYEYV